jgi:hypothetical protein
MGLMTSVTLPPRSVETYETLRAQVLNGAARPDGLGAVVYHGLVQGLTMLLCATPAGSVATRTATTAGVVARDRELLRLLTNMVLQVQSEVTHVY